MGSTQTLLRVHLLRMRHESGRWCRHEHYSHADEKLIARARELPEPTARRSTSSFGDTSSGSPGT